MKGFTLIEIIITLSIFCMLLAVAIPITYDAYRSAIFRSDKENLISLLQTARQEAIDNKNDTEHGIHVEMRTATLFQGSQFVGNPSINEIQRNFSSFSFDNVQDFVFSKVNGNALHNGQVILSDNKRSATITISVLGQIDFSS